MHSVAVDVRKTPPKTFLNLSPKGFDGAVDGHPFTLGHDYSVLWLDRKPDGTPEALVYEMLRAQIAGYLGSQNRADHFLDYLDCLGENRMGFLMGRLSKDGPMYYDRDETHMITFGETGCGKFVTNIAPTCLEYRGAVVAIDPKGEVAMVTARARYERHGQIPYIIDPFGVVEKEAGQLPKWAQIVTYNPLMDLDPEHDNFEIEAERLASAMLWTPVGNEPFWRNNALDLLAGLIMHVRTFPSLEDPRDLITVRQYLDCSVREFQDLFRDMQKSTLEAVRDCGRAMYGQTETQNTFLSFVSEAKSNLSYLKSRAMKKVLRDDPDNRFTLSKVFENALLPSITRDDLDAFVDRLPVSPHKDNFLELLCCGGCSLFIVIPQEFLDVLPGWLCLITCSVLAVSARHQRFGPPTALFIDEAAQLGNLRALPPAYGIARANNMRIWTFWQTQKSISDTYKDKHAAIIGNSIRLALTVTDLETAQELSKMEGDEIKFVESGRSVTSTSNSGNSMSLGNGIQNTYSGGSSQSSSSSVSRVVEPKIRPEEIMRRVGKNTKEGMVRKSGCSAIWIQKVRYYEEPMKEFADDDPWYRKRWL